MRATIHLYDVYICLSETVHAECRRARARRLHLFESFCCFMIGILRILRIDFLQNLVAIRHVPDFNI